MFTIVAKLKKAFQDFKALFNKSEPNPEKPQKHFIINIFSIFYIHKK